MASTSSLRFRRTAAQMQALAGVERHIRSYDPNSQRKYLQDFSDAFRSYHSILDASSLDGLLTSAGTILVGDYHALPASQRFASALLEQRALCGSRPVVLGLETIFARDQHIVEEWWRREIDEQELRQRIRFDLDWGYDWAPFYELLVTAREHAEAIYGLDCMPREDLRKIGARDRHAAAKIAEMRQRHPDAQLLVLFGESHLAPGHLPRMLRQKLASEPVVTVLQNVDALYWRAAGEPAERVESVRVNEQVVCVFNSTPLEKYENYRLYLDRWSRASTDGPDVGPTIYNLIGGIAQFLKIDSYSPHNGTQPRFLVDMLPEVYCRASDAMLRRLLSRKGVTDADRDAMRQKIEQRGSAYLPAVNAFYVRDFQLMYAAEEATRFLHHACRGLPARLNGHVPAEPSGKDRFYGAALEHALGYFGSRVLDPARPAVREADLLTRDRHLPALYNLPEGEHKRRVEFLMAHREYELNPERCGAAPRALEEALQQPRSVTLDSLAQPLGYLLGTDLYDAYLEGVVPRNALRQIFLSRLEAPGAWSAYVRIVNAVRNKKKRPRSVVRPR